MTIHAGEEDTAEVRIPRHVLATDWRPAVAQETSEAPLSSPLSVQCVAVSACKRVMGVKVQGKTPVCSRDTLCEIIPVVRAGFWADSNFPRWDMDIRPHPRPAL